MSNYAEKGYAATRIDDVAKRAGVSKGLTYLYYKTKEDLFKAVVKNIVVRRVDSLIGDVETTELSSEEFIRGPLLEFMKKVPGSPMSSFARAIIRSMTSAVRIPPSAWMISTVAPKARMVWIFSSEKPFDETKWASYPRCPGPFRQPGQCLH